jgi:hypothetical protein
MIDRFSLSLPRFLIAGGAGANSGSIRSIERDTRGISGSAALGRSSDSAKISAETTSGPRGVIGLVAGVPTAAAKGFLRAALFGEVFLTLDVIVFFTWRKGKFFAMQNFTILNGNNIIVP